jgi:hypothetical protein
MMTRRTLEGALKCALRDFRREEEIAIRRKTISIYPVDLLAWKGCLVAIAVFE